MDKNLIHVKLERLRRCVERIKAKTPSNEQALFDDYDLQDILCVNLERAVQVCVDLASHLIAESELAPAANMADCFEQLRRLGVLSDELAARMKKAVGFRNIAVHAYQDINWRIVYAIITHRLNDFVDFAKAVARAADTV